MAESNRPQTIDIEAINNNLSKKINAIKQTGYVEDQPVEVAKNKKTTSVEIKKPNKSVNFLKKPLLLLIIYMIIHNKFFKKLLFSKVKFFENINDFHLKALINGIILTLLYSIIEKFIK